MDFGNTNIKIFFILLSFCLSMANGININCNGKAFHCVNSTHFKICVDLGGGVSKTVDDFLLPCPYNTYCRLTNNYECEYYETTTSTTLITSEFNVINNFEASVIPLFSDSKKLEATSDTNIPPSGQNYATEYDESSVPQIFTTSTPSFTDNEMIKHIENTSLSTTHIIEDVSTKDLKNVTNQTIFEATIINNEVKSNDNDFNVNVLKTTTKNFDHITNLPDHDHISFSTTENFETIFKINNISAVEILPTTVASYENSENKKTSGISLNMEVTRTKPNDSFFTNNNTSTKGINSINSINNSDVLDSETIVFHKTNKKIELANIISTPLIFSDRQLLQNITQENLSELFESTHNSTSNMGLINKIANNAKNQTLIVNSHNISSNRINLALINDNLQIQHPSTPSLYETTNTNAEIISMTPIEGNSTSNFSFPLSTTEIYETTAIKTDLSNVTDFKNNPINSTNRFFDENNSSSSIFVLPTEISVTNTPESHESKLFSNSYPILTTNVISTTESYNNKQLLQNDIEKYLVNEIVHSNTNYTLNGLQETTNQTKQKQSGVSQKVSMNINPINKTNEMLNQYDEKGNLILQDNKNERKNNILNISNFNENVKFNNLNSTLSMNYSTMPTTEKYEQKSVPNMTVYETAHTENISNGVPRFSFINNAITKVLFPSTEKYKTTTVSSESTGNLEIGNRKPTVTYKATTLSNFFSYVTLFPKLFKDNLSNRDIYYQGNYTTMAYDESQTENPFLSTTETFEPALLIMKLNESSNANSTNGPSRLTKTESLPIEHPPLMITKNYETRHNLVIINPIDNTNILNASQNPFDDKISIPSETLTDVPQIVSETLSNEKLVTPALTGEIASNTQINETRMNNSITQFKKDLPTTIVDLLTTPKLTLYTKTESAKFFLNISSTPTVTYEEKTLSENLSHLTLLPKLFKDNSSNSDKYYQRNYTKIAYDNLQTENPLLSTTETFEPTLIIIKLNESSYANSTNDPSRLTKTEDLPIEHPPLMKTKNYETRHNQVIINPIDDTNILNASQNPFDDKISIPSETLTDVPQIVSETLSNEKLVTPALTGEIASNTQINETRMNNSITQFKKDLPTTIVDLLTTPKLTLYTKTESAKFFLNISSTPTVTYEEKTLSENLSHLTLLPELFKDNSSNSDKYYQRNYTTIAYDNLQTENPLLSTTETFEPTLVIIKLNESSNANSTNDPSRLTKTEGLPIEHPPLMITKYYETRHNQVIINPIDDTNILNASQNLFDDKISIPSETSTDVPQIISESLSNEKLVTPALTGEIASNTQINETRMNNSITQFKKDLPTTIVDLLTTPKLTLYTKTESAKIFLNISSTPTVTNEEKTLSENLSHVTLLPELFKDNSSNSDKYYQRNYTTIAYDNLQTENPLLSTTETFEPTLLIIKQNKSTDANVTNAHLTHTPNRITKMEGLSIEHPSLMITKSYETKFNQVTINQADDTYTLNKSTNPFEERRRIPSKTSTDPSRTVSESRSGEKSVTPAPTGEIASNSQINGNRMNSSITQFKKDFSTTIADLLNTPKLTLYTKTESATISDSKTILGILTLKTTTPYTYINIDENSPIYNPGLESKNNEEKSDSKLFDAAPYIFASAKNKSLALVSHNLQNLTSKLITSNADDNANQLLPRYKNSTIFVNNSQNLKSNASNLFLNKSEIPHQFIKNLTYDSKHPSDTIRDFTTDLFSTFNETKYSINTNNKTSNKVIRDETNIGEKKLDNNSRPTHSTILDNQYVFNQSKELKTNVSNAQITSSDNKNIKTFKSGIRINNVSLFIEPNKPINASSLITPYKELIPKKSQKNNNHTTQHDSTNYDLNNNITRFKNINGESLAALILPNTSFNSTPYKNYNQSQRTTSSNSNVKINYTQTAIAIGCQNRPTGKYADKNDCMKFYLCLGEVQPFIGECPNGTVFSESKKQCTKNLSECYRNNQFRCLSAGRYYDLSVKNVYYICVQNRGKFIKFKYQCQKGYSLNKKIIQCIQDSSKSFIANSNDSSNTKEESISISLESSSKGIEEGKTKVTSDNTDDNENKFECKKEGKFPHPNQCNKYYLCSKTRESVFRRRLKNCDSDEVFDTEKRECVDSDSRECE